MPHKYLYKICSNTCEMKEEEIPRRLRRLNAQKEEAEKEASEYKEEPIEKETKKEGKQRWGAIGCFILAAFFAFGISVFFLMYSTILSLVLIILGIILIIDAIGIYWFKKWALYLGYLASIALILSAYGILLGLVALVSLIISRKEFNGRKTIAQT